jgi:hypothetical protein
MTNGKLMSLNEEARLFMKNGEKPYSIWFMARKCKWFEKSR